MDKKWYVVNVYSGFEKKVSDAIREQVAKKGLEDAFGDILIPSEEIIQIRRGAKVTKESNYFPGYILVHMILTDEIWHVIRNIPRVSSFLGMNGKPTPMRLSEVNRIREQMKEASEKPRLSIHFDTGENIRVTDGAFTSFTGFVEEVDYAKSRLKVSVVIFGRPTPVDLEFTQVEKV